ncbi:putative Phox domain, PX domain superfamily protein [Plasmopara halstedii]
MGCTQSKASIDEVTERKSIDTPAQEAPISESKTTEEIVATIESPPASKDLVKNSLKTEEIEIVKEAPPTSTNELPPASDLEVEVAEPALPATYEFGSDVIHHTEEIKEAIAPEVPVEKPTAPINEISDAELSSTKRDSTAAIKEITCAETNTTEEEPIAPIKIPNAESTATEDELPTPMKIIPDADSTTKDEIVETVEANPEAFAVESTVQEQASPSASADISTDKLVEEEPEPIVETSPSDVTLDKPVSEGALTFLAQDVTFNDANIAFYNFSGTDTSNPAEEKHISKRYSEFKALYTQLLQQLADSKEGKTSDLPALPKTSFLQGRKNLKMLEERKTQFTVLLNAIAAHPIASHSDVFKAFLA